MQPLQPFTCFMDVEQRTYIDELFSNDNVKVHKAIICIKNVVIGSNRQKKSIIEQNIVPRLKQILMDKSLSSELRLDCGIVIGSLAKGSDQQVHSLIELKTVELLLDVMTNLNTDKKLIEVCMCALKSILQFPFAPTDLFRSNIETLSYMISLASENSTIQCQINVVNILVPLCNSYNEQMMLCQAGAIPFLARLMTTEKTLLQIPALKCLAAMCFTNRAVSDIVCSICHNQKCIPDILTNLLSRANCGEIQLAAARCLTYIHRSNSLKSTDNRIVYKTLPCLARLCSEDFDKDIRATAAETLAYLAEIDSDLQRLAAISNHLINSLYNLLHCQSALARQGSFRCFASLGANDEDIRKRIIEMEGLMEEVLAGLCNSCPDVRLAAVRCLHSLSRSVQQLRTTFQDHSVWRPLMALLTGQPSNELLTVVTSTICNLLLEFSPAKEPMLESGVVGMLCELTKNDDPALRLNGSWALMNMAFQAEQHVKTKIINTLGTERIFQLLADSDTRVIMKTLGVLRNLLSDTHIDSIMSDHSKQVLRAMNLVLDSPHPSEVKEQALCILGNIAAGARLRDYIMEDEFIIKKIAEYMDHTDLKLQAGALFAIGNLLHRNEKHDPERQAKLRELGVIAKLHELMDKSTTDPQFSHEIKLVMRQFGLPFPMLDD